MSPGTKVEVAGLCSPRPVTVCDSLAQNLEKLVWIIAMLSQAIVNMGQKNTFGFCLDFFQTKNPFLHIISGTV